MTIKKYQSYISLLFIKNFIKISVVFFCVIILVNFFEEIRFSEKYDIEIHNIIYLSALNAPSLVFEILPFVFFVSIKFFYLNLSENNELEIFNSNGISNLKIIYIISIVSVLLGIFLLSFYYTLSSSLKSHYLDIKNRFSNSNEYLAVVNDDGLWIKEEIDNKLYIIHAEKFKKNKLEYLTINETSKYYDNKNTILAESANINSKNWRLENVSILNENGKSKEMKSFIHNSSFNGEIISNLFSNLNALNIHELHKLSNSYSNIGYSNTDIKIHLNKIYSMPLFYILMTILGFIIINKLKHFKSKFFVIIIGIFISVIVYYLNYFSSLLGNNGVLPIYLSVWVPLFILFLICNIGLLKINEN
tara:strand:- start:3678 stop:4760 length:1083 start_codon:yes stop_codon:yes gene_type:complete